MLNTKIGENSSGVGIARPGGTPAAMTALEDYPTRSV